MTDWLPIRYRDFYDIPRAVIVEWHDQIYMLECPLEPEANDYPSTYEAYKLPNELRGQIDAMSWTDLAHHGSLVGRVHISQVEFDHSRRQTMSAAAFRQLLDERVTDRSQQ